MSRYVRYCVVLALALAAAPVRAQVDGDNLLLERLLEEARLSSPQLRALPYAAIPCCGGAFSANPECCSLEFSGKMPGVIDGMSMLYADWKGTESADGLVEVAINNKHYLELTRELWACGFPVGPSSGINFAAALEAQERLGPEAIVVTVFPDRMERYFSHPVFEGKGD